MSRMSFIDEAQEIINSISDDKQCTGKDVKEFMSVMFDFCREREKQFENNVAFIRKWKEITK